MRQKLALILTLIMQASVFADREATIKFREAYTYFFQKNVREIYPGSIFCSQLEFDFDISKHLGVFLNLDYLHKSGHSVTLHHSTSLDMGVCSLGARLFTTFQKRFSPYLGLGLTEALIHTHDKSPYVKKITNRFSTGFISKSGCDFILNKHLIVDLFIDYSYQPLHVYYKPALNREHINMGSLKIGAGIGGRF